MVASGDEKGWLRLWRATNGEMIAERQAGQIIQDVAFSPDGARLALALWDGTIAILQVRELSPRG